MLQAINTLFDLEAERAVLGSCVIDPRVIAKVAAILAPDGFYRQGHGFIFAALLALSDTDKPIDVVTLAAQLESQKQLEQAGGHAGITELIMGTPTALYAEHYAAIVADKAMLRNLEAAAQTIVKAVYNADSAEQAVDEAEAALLKVTLGKQASSVQRAGDVMRDFVEELSAATGDVLGIPTDFVFLDRLLGGLQKTNLYTLAARPGVGKTAFAMSLALVATKKYNARTVIFSLEMSNNQLITRLTSVLTGIDSTRITPGRLTDDEWPAVLDAANTIQALPLLLNDTGGLTIDQLRREARRLQQTQGLDLIIVDYLQLLSGGGKPGRDDNRTQEISAISRGLKDMAKELRVPVISLSQLNRNLESRADKRPMLSDLRESGSIEQDSDVVLFLYRDDYYDEHSDRPNICDVIVAKNRHGATGTVSLFFRKELTEFRDLEIKRTELNP